MNRTRLLDLALLTRLDQGDTDGQALYEHLQFKDAELIRQMSLLYPRLHHLTAEHLIERTGETVATGASPRYVYRITPAGRRALEPLQAALEAELAQNSRRLKLFGLARPQGAGQ